MPTRKEPTRERKTTKLTLADLSLRYGSLLKLIDELQCGLVITDGAGTTLFVNNTMAEWMRADPAELLGENRAWLVAEQESAVLAERDLVRAGDTRARLMVLRRRDGTTFPVLMLPNCLQSEGQTVGLAFLVIEMATVQTARRIGDVGEDDRVMAMLQTMAMQLRHLVEAGPHREPPIDLRHPALREISRRELEVLDMLLQGERVATIAEQLFISHHTVRNHLKSMFRKTGTSSQALLVGWVRALN